MSKTEIISCEICGKEFNKYTRKWYERLTCSVECANSLRSRRRGKRLGRIGSKRGSNMDLKNRSKENLKIGCMLVFGVILIIMGSAVIGNISPYRSCNIWTGSGCFERVPKSSSELLTDYLGALWPIILGVLFIIGSTIALLVQTEGFQRYQLSRSQRSSKKPFRTREKKYDYQDEG